MNHSFSGSLVLSKAIFGFSNYKSAEGLTERWVDSYQPDLEQWVGQYSNEVPCYNLTGKIKE